MIASVYDERRGDPWYASCILLVSPYVRALHGPWKGATTRMPAYDYRCTACDDVFEVHRPMSSKGEEHCPACRAPGARIFSPVPVAFKGTGFHNTDYKPRPTDPAEKPAEKPATPCPAASASGCAGCPSAE